MKKLFQEFKEFAVKGNMIDIAIGVIIGTAFNKVIDVLVKQVFLPPLSMLTDGVNWQNKAIVLREAIMDANGAVTQEKVAIGYGALMEALVDFVIIAACTGSLDHPHPEFTSISHKAVRREA